MNVVPTTVLPPRVTPTLVRRPTLEALTDKIAQSRLTAISAPAGSGKTTAMLFWADRLRETGRPVLWLAAAVVGDLWAAEIGAVWIVGRVIYTVGYSKEAAKRGPGFLVTILPTAVLTVIALWGVIQAFMA